MSATTCRCGATWTGLRIEHCTVCHETFSGTISGDKHRRGDHAVPTGPDARRCLTPDEMRAKGMTQNARGVWTNGGTSPWAATQCDGSCHETDRDDCPLCGSYQARLMCDDCRFYAGQDGGAA